MKLPSGFEEYRVALDWGELAVVDNRHHSAPILALHGWLDNASSFYRLMREYGGSQRWIVADLAGHGRSDPRPAGSRYDLVDYALDIVALAEAMKLDRFELLGHSLGGAVALIVAAMIPEKISHLTLIDSLGPLARQAHSLSSTLMNYHRAKRDQRAKKRPFYDSLKIPAEARARISDLSPALAEELLERSLERTEKGYTWRSDPRLRLPVARPISEDDVNETLQEVQCPVLLIRAEPGLYRKNYPAEARSKHLRDLTEVVVPGGHHVHMESAAAVAEAIRTLRSKQTKPNLRSA